MMCDHCLAPDTTSAGDIGCDNMTVLIVAITHGRKKEEWIKWIKERVKNQYGYKTSGTPPQLYSESRLRSYRARTEAREARERLLAAQVNNPTSSSSGDDNLHRRATTIGINGDDGGKSHQAGDIVTQDEGTTGGSSFSHFAAIVVAFLSKLLKTFIFQ